MATVRMTAKRQATFPKKLCDEMHVQAGDSLVVQATEVDGVKVWILRPVASAGVPWFGSPRQYAEGKRHDMRSVRRSIQEVRTHG